ncbi:MAG TPA: ABC transporter permease [Acidimicrobiia bacterium]|nr:ABC transporter permease [Acidimicrobiia bacterium]
MTTPETAVITPGDSPRETSRARPLGAGQWSRLRWRVGVLVEAVLLLGVWQLLAALEVLPPAYLPSPTDVWQALVELWTAGTLPEHTLFTLQNFLLGFLLAVVVAIPVGIVMGSSDLAEMLFAPPMWAVYAVPRIALAPIFVIAFGLGGASKIAVVFTMATFPILINTMHGMKSVPTLLVQVAKVYGGSRTEVVRKIVLPSLLPYIFVGLQIAVAGAIAGALVGEFIGSFKGLGLLLSNAAYNFDLARALALVIIIVIIAQALMSTVQLAKKMIAPWDVSSR